MKKTVDNSGYTLIEALVYMVITVFVLVASTTFAVDVVRESSRLVQAKDLHQQARLIMSRISQDIKTAPDMAVSPDQSILSLKDSAGAVIADYEFSSTTEKLFYKTPGHSQALGGTGVDITAGTFTELDASVRIELTLRSKQRLFGQSQPYTLNHSAYVVLRPKVY